MDKKRLKIVDKKFKKWDYLLRKDGLKSNGDDSLFR